jgi:hypothetical protein
VTLSEASNETVTVDYATIDGTATAGTNPRQGADYIATSGTITFNAGETSQTFDIDVFADRTAEGNETILLNFSNASNAELGNSQAVFTIIDDDGASQPVNSKPANDQLLPGQHDSLGDDTLFNSGSSNVQDSIFNALELDNSSLGTGNNRLENGTDPLSHNSDLLSLSTLPWDNDYSMVS